MSQGEIFAANVARKHVRSRLFSVINIVRRGHATAACDRLRNPEQLGRPHFALPAPDAVECVEGYDRHTKLRGFSVSYGLIEHFTYTLS